jgi:hypothetical protein
MAVVMVGMVLPLTADQANSQASFDYVVWPGIFIGCSPYPCGSPYGSGICCYI